MLSDNIRYNLLAAQMAGAVRFSGKLVYLKNLRDVLAPDVPMRTVHKTLLPRIRRYYPDIAVLGDHKSYALVVL